MAIVDNTLLKEYLPEIQGTGIDAELTALKRRSPAIFLSLKLRKVRRYWAQRWTVMLTLFILMARNL